MAVYLKRISFVSWTI